MRQPRQADVVVAVPDVAVLVLRTTGERQRGGWGIEVNGEQCYSRYSKETNVLLSLLVTRTVP